MSPPSRCSEEQQVGPGCIVEVGTVLLPGGLMQVRAKLSDGGILRLHRTDAELAGMMKRLVDGFPEEGHTLPCRLLPGLLAVQAADQTSDPEVKVTELNKLLSIIIHLPDKFSQSEAVLAFFEPSATDQIGRQEEVQTIIQEEVLTDLQEEVLTKIQEEPLTIIQEEVLTKIQEEPLTMIQEEVLTDIQEEVLTKIHEEVLTNGQDNPELRGLQSTTSLSEVLMSNGFCLANTETILVDLTPPTQDLVQPDSVADRRASVGTAVCLELCHPSISPHLLRGFTGMMGKLVKRQSFRCTEAPPT